MAFYRLEDHIPQVADSAWVADSADVIGQVRLEAEASVWFGAVLRGDNALIRVGAGTNVQDGAVLHVDEGVPLTLEDRVTIGHQVMLHGCTVGEGSLIGIQSVILNGARIGRHCLVGAGSLITERAEFPDGVLILGRPAKVVRSLTPEQIAGLEASAAHYVAHARHYRSSAERIALPVHPERPRTSLD